MELLSRNHDPSWDRVVYICVHEKNGLSEYINDNTLYKVLVLNEGTITISGENCQRIVSAPALILISDKGICATCSEGGKNHNSLFQTY